MQLIIIILGNLASGDGEERMVRVRFRLAQLAKCAACFVKRAACFVKRAARFVKRAARFVKRTARFVKRAD